MIIKDMWRWIFLMCIVQQPCGLGARLTSPLTASEATKLVMYTAFKPNTIIVYWPKEQFVDFTKIQISVTSYLEKFPLIRVVQDIIDGGVIINGLSAGHRYKLNVLFQKDHLEYLLLNEISFETARKISDYQNLALYKSYKFSKGGETLTNDLNDGTTQHCMIQSMEKNSWIRFDLMNTVLILEVLVHKSEFPVYSNNKMDFQVLVGESRWYSENSLCRNGFLPLNNALIVSALCLSPLPGRYVNLVANSYNYLRACEIEIMGFSDYNNIGFEKMIAYSSLLPVNSTSNVMYQSQLSVNVGVSFSNILNKGNCFSSAEEFKPWLSVDLRFPSFVRQIIVQHPSDSPRTTLPLLITVGQHKEFYFNKVCEEILWSSGLISIVHCREMLKGRYVHLILDGTGQLTLCDVQVIGLEGYMQQDFMQDVGWCMLPQDTRCGFGTQRFCTIKDRNWIEYFCPRSPKNVACFTQECPFSAPQNLFASNITGESFVLRWAPIPLSALTNNNSIVTGYNVVVTETEYVIVRNITVPNDWVLLDGLTPLTEYSVQISGVVNTMMNGEYTEQLFIRTSSGEPSGPPFNFTGRYLDSQSIIVSWENNITVTAMTHGLLVMRKHDGGNIQNTNINLTSTSYVFKNLSIYTTYKFKMAFVNDYGRGPFSLETEITTDGVAPKVPPVNITVFVMPTGPILLSWTQPMWGIFGPLCSNTIQTQFIKVKGRRMKRGMNDIETLQGFKMSQSLTVTGVTSADVASVVTGNAVYEIRVSVNTRQTGVFSDPLLIETLERSPLLSAVDVTCVPLNDRSIKLLWKPSHPAWQQGVITKYKVYYKKINDTEALSATLQSLDREYQIGFLTNSTNYTIWLTAFTLAGEGAATENLNCATKGSIPSSAPKHLNSVPYTSPTSCSVTWSHLKDNEWNSDPLGYILLIEKVNGIPNTQYIRLKMVSSYTIRGLTLYSVYLIKIAAYSSGGQSKWSRAIKCYTCFLSEPQIDIQFHQQLPYVYSTGNDNQPVGSVVQLVQDAIKDCVVPCQSYGKDAYISYKTVYKNVTENASLEVNDTRVVIPSMYHSPAFAYVRVTKTPGFVLVSVPENDSEKSSRQEGSLLDGVFKVIPLCGLYILVNFLFGAIFWFIEPFGGNQKYCLALAGIFDSFYLTLMTSTTVGYGDKTPLTKRGRVYFVFWTFLGLLLTTIVVGNLSSSLTSGSITSMRTLVPNEKIVAKYGSVEYQYALKKFKKLEKDRYFYTYNDVLSLLQNGSFKFALINQPAADMLKYTVEEYGLKFSKIISVTRDIGMGLYGEMKPLRACVQRFTDNKQSMVSKTMEEMKESLLSKQQKPSSNNPPQRKVESMVSWDAPLYQTTLTVLLVMLVCFVVIGFMYQAVKMNRKEFSKKDLLLRRQKRLVNFSRHTKKCLLRLLQTFESDTKNLLDNHDCEILDLKERYAKLYSLTFRNSKFHKMGLYFEEIALLRDNRKWPRSKRKFTKWLRYFKTHF